MGEVALVMLIAMAGYDTSHNAVALYPSFELCERALAGMRTHKRTGWVNNDGSAIAFCAPVEGLVDLPGGEPMSVQEKLRRKRYGEQP